MLKMTSDFAIKVSLMAASAPEPERQVYIYLAI